MDYLDSDISHAHAICRTLADKGMPEAVRVQCSILKRLIDIEFDASAGLEQTAKQMLISCCNTAEEVFVGIAKDNAPVVIAQNEERDADT